MFEEKSIAYNIKNFFRSIGIDDFNSEIYEVVDWNDKENEWIFTVERVRKE